MSSVPKHGAATSQMPEVTQALPKFSDNTLLISTFALATLLIAIFVYVSRRKTFARGSAVLLVGSPDAGKTAILTSMVYNQTLQTHTSLQVNSSTIQLPSTKRPLRFVDIPGHPRLRVEYKEYLPDTKAIAFVVDASSIARNGPAVAEHLHHILHGLTTLPPTQTPPALCILAHKADLLTTPSSTSTPMTSEQLAVSRVRTILERELEKRRASQAGGVGVEGLGTDDHGTEMSGLECRSSGGVVGFRFADWEGGEVTFLATSVGMQDKVETAEDGLVSFKEWLADIIQ